MKTLSLLLCLISLSGCVGISYTENDQAKSLNHSGILLVDRPVKPYIESKNSEKLSPKQYLSKHNVIFASGPSTNEIEPKFVASVKQHNYEYNVTWPDGVTSKQVSGGSGAAISDDGYIITAYHCIDRPAIWAFSTVMNNETTISTRIAKCRIVFADEEADFAIVKAPIDTPYFLTVREEPIQKGEVLLAGSTINSHGGGKFLWSNQLRGSSGREFLSFSMTIPMKQGDSGSAVIDSQGRLCGVVTTALRGRWIVDNLPRSNAILLDAESILKIIKEDRKANMASEATAHSRAPS